MTYPNSSISSSDARRYVWVLSATFAALLGLSTFACYFGTHHGIFRFAHDYLYQYQREKIRTSSPVDTVFLGDSSLGNSIDAAAMEKLLGRPTLNLALTGSYGYGGTFNMLLHALERHPLRNVVIAQTVDMPLRLPMIHSMGYVQTSDGLSTDILPWTSRAKLWLRLYVNWQTLQGVTKGFANAVSKPSGTDADSGLIVNDYILQGKRLAAENFKLPLAAGPPPISHDSTIFLERIGEVCRQRGLNCIYMFPPLYEKACPYYGPTIAATAAMAERLGFTVVEGGPICLPAEMVGDSADHISPQFKSFSTETYARRLLPLLR